MVTAHPITIAILGASGYTGAELLRLLAHHPGARIKALTGDSQAGKAIGDVFPQLAAAYDLPLVTHDTVDYHAIDLVFCCLPHGTTQAIIAGLPASNRVIDLSADFRLSDPHAYAEWYGHAHQALHLQTQAVYGLTEHARDAVHTARLVANPGCYPTAVLLPLLPLVQAQLIDPAAIIVSAMSGVSGAGRKVTQSMLFSEVAEGVKAYGVGGHRHVAEIEQVLGDAAGAPLTLSFTPHLVPMNRGISATIHVTGEAASIRAQLQSVYGDEPFIHICPHGTVPTTHAVRGTNACHISVAPDRRSGQTILVSVIDNLVKGAAGQAVQNMNVMFGMPEQTALAGTALTP